MLVNGVPCLFTSLRIDRKTLPSNLYAYDIRDSDDGKDFFSIERNVRCDHAGTIITDQEIPMTEGDYTLIEDYNFIDNDGSEKLLAMIESIA